MKFIVIVIGVLIIKRMGSLSQLQQDGWYRDWAVRLASFEWLKSKPSVQLLLSVLVPVLLLASVLLLLDNHWFGIPVFVLSFFVFLYSLGRGNLEEQVEGYQEDLNRDDLQAAYHDAAVFNSAREVGEAENSTQLHQEAVGSISYRYFERYFAVIFWFVLAGAPGALLYRLLVLRSDMNLDSEPEDKYRVQHGLHLMEWLPARLLGLSLAFVGNFTACLDSWRASVLSGSMSTVDVIEDYVSAALYSGARSPMTDSSKTHAIKTEAIEISALFSRTLIFSLCVVAFLVILI
jgi:AmpE protein